MDQSMTSYPESTSCYRVERIFAGERSAQEVVTALIRAHC